MEIAKIIPVDLIELSYQYFALSPLDEKGNLRKQNQSEIIVLVIEYFKRWLDELGHGARVLNGVPHIYGGTHWTSLSDEECMSILGLLAERLGNHVVDSRIFFFREKLLKQFYSDLSVKDDDMLPDRVLINFHNGTLEFVNGRESLREFRQADLLTYQLPFSYQENSSCPMFEKYLCRVLPDSSSRDVLAEFLGWLFLRDLKLEKVLVLLGDGHNGKSVFFDIVNALLGIENVSNLGLSSLLKIENRHQLAQSLLNFGSELSNRCDFETFKKLASGEPVEARRLYKDVFMMRNYARLAFNANVLPKDTEHTTGFFRRFLIVPFTEVITEVEKDPDLAKKIIADELPGVFTWVMQGLRRLRSARKFSACDAADQALATYRMESDSVAMFLQEECWQPSAENRIGKEILYSDYRAYCVSAGCHPLSKNNFGKRLFAQHQIADSKSGSCRFWHLIRSDTEE